MTKPISRKMAVDCLLHRFALGKMFLSCGICGHVVLPSEGNIQFDHHHAIVHDGPHEYQNLRPVHAECHKKKTKADVQANAKIKRLRGELKPRRKLKIPGRKLQSRPFKQGKLR